MNPKTSAWSGTMLLGVGWAMLDASACDNRPHRHVAHQISLALDTPCEIGGDRPVRLAPGEAALIPAGLLHSLAPAGAALRTIYVDPMFGGMRDFVHSQAIVALTKREASGLRSVDCGAAAKRWIGVFLGKGPARPIDQRLQAALVSLEPGITPSTLALEIGLSPTRLREIAVRDFGVPTVKLLQWLQLQHAIDALHRSGSLADAAQAGCFSDQAHFTRRLIQWFGVTPSQGLARLKISVIR